jgi:hypothetical protein
MDYCSKQRCWENNIFETEEEFEVWLSEKLFFNNEFDLSNLSEPAKIIFDYIIKREWEIPGKAPRKPSYSLVERNFSILGWKKVMIKSAWDELKIWWKCA